jgi:hypothetical protein
MERFLPLERHAQTITPIIFSVQKHASVLDLLAPDTHVTFDLDGTVRDARWSWTKPDTGLLVWDPQNKGEITSGRQLFGTATWWLLFPNGYAALDALDDDRDGVLSGSELRGVGVWFDKNGNGRSDPQGGSARDGLRRPGHPDQAHRLRPRDAHECPRHCPEGRHGHPDIRLDRVAGPSESRAGRVAHLPPGQPS